MIRMSIILFPLEADVLTVTANQHYNTVNPIFNHFHPH